jgi:hypothetical protein
MPFSRIMTLGPSCRPGTVLCTAALLLTASLSQSAAAGPAASSAQAPAASSAQAPAGAKPPAKAPPAAAKGVAKPAVKPTPKVPGKGPATATPPAPAATAKASCQGSEGQVSLLPAEGDIKCNEEFEDCDGKIELVANNCTGEFQSFYKLELYEGGRRQQILEFDPAGLASPGGGRWKETIPWTTPGELEAVVYYHPPGQSGEFSVRGPVKVINRALNAAKEACVKCEGTWGRFGVNKFQGCNCKMPDAGKTCYDGDECQGYCLFRRYDSEAREEGECSETQRIQGCVGIIFKGQSKVEPRRPPPRKQATCID